MKKFLVLVVVIVAGALGYYYFQNNQPEQLSNDQALNPTTNQSEPMKITSLAFEHEQNIPAKYTCDGENINPALEFSDVPENTQSLVLIMDDPDAPMGTWVHWTLWGIEPSTNQIAENSVPAKAIQGKTSSGQNNYGGPCPPSGTHRYFFKLFALDTELKLPSFSEKQDLEKAMEEHIIDQAELVGLYSRN